MDSPSPDCDSSPSMALGKTRHGVFLLFKYGLSLTGLRFFTVYGPWGRPDMVYFFFSRDILKGKSIPIFEASNHGTVARDFTYIDDIVQGCLAVLDTAEKSTGSGEKKKGPAQLRVFNLGNTSPVPISV